jgi:DNA invertase Pin-like site-specific DNA recombinase
MPLVISYARYSSTRQSEGTSLRRQVEKAEKYASDNNLILDTERSFEDLGVSGYDMSNVHKGALGLFLKEVDAGRFPPGTMLIVESFDRLSRAEPLDALSLFIRILSAGLSIVTLTEPPKVFSRETVRDNHYQLLEALLVMYRAHEESKTKSDRINTSWKKKRERAKDGALMSLRAPAWIKVHINYEKSMQDKDRRWAELHPERAPVALRIIEMAEGGVGGHTILKTLHAEGVEPWSKPRVKKGDNTHPKAKWEPSYLQKMLTNPSLYGAIKIGDDIIPGYYPPLIEKARFERLQVLRTNRASTQNKNRKGKTLTNLFSGLLRCGYCGASGTIAGHKSLRTGYERKYIGCHGARVGSTKCKMTMWYMDELEPSLLFWLSQVNYAKILGIKGNSDVDAQLEQLASMEADAARLRIAIENGHKAILEGLLSLVPRVKEDEIKLAALERSIGPLKQTIESMQMIERSGPARMKTLVLLFKELKHQQDAHKLRILREQISVGIHQVVDKIVLFPRGRSGKEDKDTRYIEVFFKNGEHRIIEPGEC